MWVCSYSNLFTTRGRKLGLSLLVPAGLFFFFLPDYQRGTQESNKLNALSGIRMTETKQETGETWAPVQLLKAHQVGKYTSFHNQGGGILIILKAANTHPPPCCEKNPHMLHLQPDWEAPWQLPGSGVAEKGCFYLLMRSIPVAPCLSTSFSLYLPCVVKHRRR